MDVLPNAAYFTHRLVCLFVFNWDTQALFVCLLLIGIFLCAFPGQCLLPPPYMGLNGLPKEKIEESVTNHKICRRAK